MSTLPPVLVLTAGLGTRLRPLTWSRAKPAVPVANIPLVVRILRWLSSQGALDVVLNLHHRPDTITRWVGDGADNGLRVRYSWESPLVLGSAGGPRQALPLLAAPHFLIVNGDTLTDVSLRDLVSAHQESSALVTLAVVPNTAPDRYGGVLVDDEGCVTGFTRRGSPVPSWHFIGVQAADARAFASLDPGRPAESIGELYPRLMADAPRAVRAWRTQGLFLDVGTPADYLAANRWLAARERLAFPLLGTGHRIAASADVRTSIVWDDVSVGEGARLEGCIVADGVQIPAGACFADRVLVPAPPPPFALPDDWRLDGRLMVAPLAAGTPLNRAAQR
jgi:NDP-sugar pyrophosphorylase family protein